MKISPKLQLGTVMVTTNESENWLLRESNIGLLFHLNNDIIIVNFIGKNLEDKVQHTKTKKNFY